VAQGERIRDKAWSDIFEVYDVLDAIKRDGFADITAKQFHALHLQPRLNTKMDHATQVPLIFQEHGLNILTRGIDTWRVGTFEVFETLPEWTLPGDDVKNLTIPSYIQTLDVTNVTGEPAVINAAQAAGLLSDFCDEELILTVSGRMRTGDFTYNVNDTVRGTSEIAVSKAQIEIDAGYEGENAFTLFEVKNHLSRDFLVRQLFYPFVTWTKRLPSKPLRTVFLTLANDVYDLYEYGFEPSNYSSATLLKHRRYTIGVTKPTEAEVVTRARKVVESEPVAPKTNVPFPQADDFERVMDLVSFIAEEPRTVEDLALNYDFHSRQSGYYSNAAKYLGLVESGTGEDGREYSQATDLAREILELDYRAKVLRYAELALAIKPVAEAYYEWTRSGSAPTVDWVAERFASSPFAVTNVGERLSESTVRRRAQTILSWTKWLRGIAK
jgi:hypothetical protein